MDELRRMGRSRVEAEVVMRGAVDIVSTPEASASLSVRSALYSARDRSIIAVSTHLHLVQG